MTAIKAYQVDDFLSKTPTGSGIYLLYGPDVGLVNERGRLLAQTVADQNGSEIVHLSKAELDNEPDRLAILLKTPSLFGSLPVIRLSDMDSKLFSAIQPVIENKLETVLILEAASLNPKDKLRSTLERAQNCWTLPCYADDRRTINNLINQMLGENQIRISQKTQNMLSDMLGNDREITRRELEKLVNFADEKKELTETDIVQLCGDNARLSLDQILDSTGLGIPGQLEKHLNHGLSSGLEPQLILTVLVRHFYLLRQARLTLENGQTPSRAISSLKPRPHFSRTPAMENQVQKWTLTALETALKDMMEATANARKTPSLAETITRRILLSLCLRVHGIR